MILEIESFVRAIPKAELHTARLDDTAKIAWLAEWTAQMARASNPLPA